MNKSDQQAPKTIPLNCIDRVYLVPETESLTGSFFPMSIMRTLFFKNPLDRVQVRDALILIDDRFPQLRLSYRLNVHALRWERVEPHERQSHFEDMIKNVQVDHLDTWIGQEIARNVDPIHMPYNFFICGNQLSVKMFHVHADAMFLSQFIRILLFALLKPEKFDTLPDLERHFWAPIYQVIWSNPRQAAFVLGRFVKVMAQKVLRYINEVGKKKIPVINGEQHEAIVSGSEMHVVRSIMQHETLEKINALRKGLPTQQKITLNTILQVEIARRLQRLGHVGQSVVYTIPVDLHRYLKNEKTFYPGNLSTQLRITVDETANTKICDILQNETRRMLDNYDPMIGLPFEWVTNMLPRRIYDNLHRSWLLNVVVNKSRFFVLTNIGSFDTLYAEFLDEIVTEMYLSVPIMDTPLVISFHTFKNQGVFCATYNPRILSREAVMSLLDFENTPLTFEEKEIKS